MNKTKQDIFEYNRRWAEEQLRHNPHFFETLSANQTPDYLYIGCSDSRVTAEEMMGMKPGEVFVHRNIANMVNQRGRLRGRSFESQTHRRLRTLQLRRHQSRHATLRLRRVEPVAAQHPRCVPAAPRRAGRD